MKTLKCDMCDHEAQGETFEEWMEALKPHYAQAHADYMMQKGEMSDEEKMAGSDESLPSRSIKDPSGKGLPPPKATAILPSATTEVVASKMSGGPSGRGTPMAMGLVDIRRSMLPKGATNVLPETLTK